MAVTQIDSQAITADAVAASVDLSGIPAGFLYYALAIDNQGSNPVWLINASETDGPSGIRVPSGAGVYSPTYRIEDGEPRLYAAGPETCYVSVLVVTA